MRIRARRAAEPGRYNISAEPLGRSVSPHRGGCQPPADAIFLIDGEAVVCRHDGLSDFTALRSRRRDRYVTLIAFDLIELQGDDLRDHKLIDRKQRLAQMRAAMPRSHTTSLLGFKIAGGF